MNSSSNKRLGKPSAQGADSVQVDISWLNRVLNRAATNTKRDRVVNARIVQLLTDILEIYQEEHLQNVRAAAAVKKRVGS